ncbi:MAG: DUF2232 domain-containing protein [bacterium]
MALPILEVFLDVVLVAVVFTAASLASAWALLRGMSSRWVVLIGALGALVFVGVYFFFVQSSGSGFFAEGQKDFEAVWALQSPALLKSGVPQETIDLVKLFALKYFLWAFPAWMAVGCLAAGLLSYYLASALLRRVTDRVGEPLAFRYWVLPEFLIFGFITACLLKLFTPLNSTADVVGDNLLVFFIGIYTLGGLSIVSFYFNKWRLSIFWRVVNYFLMFQFCLQTLAVVAGLGMLDVWLDLRKLKPILSGEKKP